MGGIVAPGPSQTYGAMAAGGAAVSRSFTFTANGACGDTLAAVFQLNDGPNNLGTVTNFLTTGKTVLATTSFSNPNGITINDFSTATPYPSTINVSGVPQPITKITVNLFNVSHTYPSDIDILLVGPTGEQVVLMSDAGAGNPIANLN